MTPQTKKSRPSKLLGAEIWKPIFGGEYLISNMGRVFSCSNNRLMKVYYDYRGYARFNMVRFVHVLMAEAFMGPKPYAMQVNHKDGIKKHNILANLEYTTPKGNSDHAIRTGLKNDHGANNVWAKLSWAQVRQIRRMKGKYKGKIIARKFNVSPQTISGILVGRRYIESPK
jgi:hypothetical protein